jgi:pimeloyl-ACP methyl ester carboxylesterase
MGTYVLVHGAWHGAWCWEKLRSLLEAKGHRVVAIDLPAHGKDRTPAKDVTLQAYVDRVCNVLDAQRERVTLVGHSMGGVVITQTAEQRPDRIATLVYLCAFLPRAGEALLKLAESDPDGLVLPNLVIAKDGVTATLREGAPRKAFYGECSEADAAWATSRLVPDPVVGHTTPVRTTAGNWGRVPRVYIECLRDRAIPVALQRRMYTASPCGKVLSLDTDHSPFLSAPEALAAHLTSF